KPFLDFVQQLLRNSRSLRAELHGREETRRLLNGHAADFTDILPVDFDLSCFGPQPRAVARGANRIPPVAAQEYSYMQLVFLALEVGEETPDAGKPVPAVNNLSLLFRVEVVPGNVQRDVSLPGEALEISKQRAVFRLRPRLGCSFFHRVPLVWN